MGLVCSSEPASEVEVSEYKIPSGEEYRHQKCTVRAPHQLTTLQEPQKCDFCRYR